MRFLIKGDPLRYLFNIQIASLKLKHNYENNLKERPYFSFIEREYLEINYAINIRRLLDAFLARIL